MINKFNYNPSSKRENVTKSADTKSAEAVAKQSTISWTEIIFVIVAGMLFVFALTARILYEYRTDDHSNTEVTVGSCTFKNNTLIRYDGSEAIVNIPTYYEVEGEKFGITAIADRVFYYNSQIEEIYMPNQIERVGIFAFRECANLRVITLSDKLKSLGDSCFWNCSNLESIKLPSSLEKIEPYAFWNTAIKTIDIPENVKSIGLGAFNKCSQLETVYIRYNGVASTSFTSVYQAFSNCPNLKTIYVPEEFIEQYKTHQYWSLYSDKFQILGGNVNA